jgi:hypothetical protein
VPGLYFLVTPVPFGHNPGDAPPVARDDRSFAPLHLVEELEKARFGARKWGVTIRAVRMPYKCNLHVKIN